MRARLVLLLLLSSVLVGCDHATKHWAERHLEGQAPIALVDGVLDLRHAANHDVAFSLLRSIPAADKLPFLVTIGVTMVGVLALVWYQRRRGALLEQIALATMLAGAVGNVADRVVRGYVVDFIHVTHWPVFNVADVLLVVGVGLLALAARETREAPT